MVVQFEAQEPTEKTTYDAYREHVAGCLTCTTDGAVCHFGLVLHRLWKVAEADQPEPGE